MPLKGAKAHIGRLRALASASAERDISKALFAGAELIVTHAQRSITAGSVSGKGHQPSKAPAPPNNDTGGLANNIEATQPAPLRARVTAEAAYAAIHEFGGTIENAFGNGTKVTLPARPFMRPARDAKRKEVKALVEQALGRVVKKSRRSD